jgi:hypothetical protein
MGHICFMSIAEIQSELKKLTPVELAQVEAVVREIKAIPPVTAQVGNAISGTLAEYWESLRGTVTLKPGWDEDEPLEIWEALRDNPPS